MDWSTGLRYGGALAFVLQALLSLQVYKSSRLKTAAILCLFFIALGLALLPLNHLSVITTVSINSEVTSRIFATIAVYLTSLVAVYLVVKKSVFQLICAFTNTIFVLLIILTTLQNTEDSTLIALPLFIQSLVAAGVLFWQTTHFSSRQIIPMVRLGCIGLVVGLSGVIFADLTLWRVFDARTTLLLLASCLGMILLILSIFFRSSSSFASEKTRV